MKITYAFSFPSFLIPQILLGNYKAKVMHEYHNLSLYQVLQITVLLPYRIIFILVLLSAGGFRSTVTLKGPDFEASAQGGVCSGCAREARDSAAACMFARLQEMKSQLKRGDVP
jgi:hypothetical protein